MPRLENNKKAFVFDRDGTLIVDKIYLNDPEQIIYLPGVFKALRELRDMGFCFFIATNQSGVARGIVQIENLITIHKKIRGDFAAQGVDILEFYYAPFMTDTDHYYRKPNPGMLHQAISEYGIDASQSWMVGDRMTDVESGHRAKMRSILIGPQENPKDFPQYAAPELHVDGVSQIPEWLMILKESQP